HLMETIEFSLVQKDVIFGLEQGSKVLTQLNKEMRIEDVERLADDTAEAIAYQNEVSDILQSNMTAEDEEAVLEELEELERQEADRLKLDLPRAPNGALPDKEIVEPEEEEKEGEEEELEEEEEEEEETHQRSRNNPMLARC
ncbi:Vacuolar protein sorting-associated protein 20, partial [Coemansia sp. S17]